MFTIDPFQNDHGLFAIHLKNAVEIYALLIN